MLSHVKFKCKILLKTIEQKIKSFGPVRETGWYISKNSENGY